MSEDGRIDERNAALILKRAAQLQEMRSEQAGSGQTFSLQELEEAVEELGIDRALVRTAADELSIAELRNQSPWVLGGKTDLLYEATVEGKVDGARLEAMLEVVRRMLGNPGEVRTSGSAQIWSTGKGSTRRIFLTLTPKGNKTLVRLEEAMPMDARGTVGGVTAGGLMVGILTLASLKAVIGTAAKALLGPMLLLGVFLGWLVGRKVWAYVSAQRDTQVRRMFQEVLRAAAQEPAALPSGDDGES